jgi:hypothetical protein
MKDLIIKVFLCYCFKSNRTKKEKGIKMKVKKIRDSKKEINKMAEDHANFLCVSVFKPAFVMAFIHGYKHAEERYTRRRRNK